MRNVKSRLLAAALVLLETAAYAGVQGQPSGLVEAGAVRPGGSRAHGAPRQYTPRVIGRTDSEIVDGRIVAQRAGYLVIETGRGARVEFQVNDQTTLLGSSGLVSIATMADLTLRFSDLRPGDKVEIVCDRGRDRKLARIVTRLAGK